MLNISLPRVAIEDISWDGSKLLLRSESQEGYILWSYSVAEGSLQPLRAGFDWGSWAPDGTLAVVEGPHSVGAPSSLVIFGERNKVKTDLPGEVTDLKWAPDGTRLRFSLLDFKHEAQAEWEMDRRGTSKRIASLSDGHASTGEGSWRRDGRYFVYSAKTGLRQDLWLTLEKPYRLTNAGLDSWRSPVFSRDGSTIFAIHDLVRSELVQFDRKSDSWQPEWQGAAAFELDYSRDRKWVVYTRFPDHTLWKSRLDGTGRAQLTDAAVEAHQPHWSPDGAAVAFMGKNSKGQWRVFQVPARGGKTVTVLENGDDQGVPTWSPDGTKLIFGDFPGMRPRSEMCVHEIDMKMHKMSDVPGSKGLWSPRWSPNGLYIAAITVDSRALGVLASGKHGFLELARMIYVDNATWLADSRYIYFNGTSTAGVKGLFRVSVPQGRLEQIADLTNFEVARENWYGVAPDGTALAFRGVTVQEIFALKWRLP